MKQLWSNIQAIGLAVFLIALNVAAAVAFVSTTMLHFAIYRTVMGDLYALAAMAYLVCTIAMTILNIRIFYFTFFKKKEA